VVVDFAMRYGQPSVESAMNMRAQGVDRLLVIPLYPQYAGSSSAPRWMMYSGADEAAQHAGIAHRTSLS
jgi:protoheme ferro-lyase